MCLGEIDCREAFLQCWEKAKYEYNNINMFGPDDSLFQLHYNYTQFTLHDNAILKVWYKFRCWYIWSKHKGNINFEVFPANSVFLVNMTMTLFLVLC